MRDVTVYDPNGLNPYGLELASLLADSGYEVLLAHARNMVSADLAQARKLFSLPGRANRAGSRLRYLLRRIASPLQVLRLTPRESALIVVWARDPWDSFVFTVRSILGGQTFFIYHNPTKSRRRKGLAGAGEYLLSQFATTCVHSSWLASQANRSKNVLVTPHPPYRHTSNSGKLWSDSSLKSEKYEGPGAENVVRVGYIGALRVDKGCDELSNISAHSKSTWELHIVGTDKLSDALPHDGVGRRRVTYATNSEPLGDAAMMDAIRSCKVVIAPYLAVTESGSVRLAQSAGIPVLGYRSPGLNQVLTDKSLASSSEELGAMISKFLEAPWETYLDTPAVQAANCLSAWQKALK